MARGIKSYVNAHRHFTLCYCYIQWQSVTEMERG